MLKRLALFVAMLFIPALARADSVWTFDGELTDPGSWHAGFTYYNTHCNCDLDGTILFDDSFKVLAYSWTDGTHRLAQVDFELNGLEFRGLEQSPQTKSRWAKMAREGAKVMQFLRAGRYVGVVADGVLKHYSSTEKA
jgi:hypothetical protein